MKKLLLTIIIFIIMLSPKHISINNVDYFAYSRMDQSTKTNIASSLNSFKRSISNIPIYNTNKFNCTVSSSNVNCSSSSYQGVGLLSYPEYTKIGGNNSYLYSSNPYFVLNNGSVKTLTQSGLTDSEPSYVKASIYVKNGAAVKGNGSKNDPYKIVESFCYVTTDATSCIVLEGRNTLGDLPTPTRVGYTFTGWYSEETDGFKVTSSTLISELPEKRIYARWTPIKYNIMILTWYGQIENLGSDNIIATYDETYTINNPTKVVTFRGIANGTGATVGANTTNTQTFAGWNITGMDSVTHTYGSSTTTSTSISSTTATSFKNLRSTSGTVTFTAKWNSVTTNLPTVSKTGNTCGWSTTSGATTVSTITVPENNTGTLNLYAVCNPNIYTITLDNQSATSAGTTKIYEAYGKNYSLTSGGSATTTITVPSKTNYVFGGYYTGTNGSGTQIINASGSIVGSNTAFSANTTLYAYWINRYTISVTCSGCTASPTSTQVNKNGSATFTITASSGYTLTGASVTGGCTLSSSTLTASNVTSNMTCSVSAVKTYTCAAGTYLAANGTSCTTCPAGSYCTGYTGVSTSSNNGIAACSSLGTGYTSASGAKANTNCYLAVAAGSYKTSATGTTTSGCGSGKYSTAHNSYYGSTDTSCANIVAGCYGTSGATSCPSACSGRATYSTGGASSCTNVSTGYYTTGCTSSSRCTGQAQCEPGYMCSSGIRYICDAGGYVAGYGSTSCPSCGFGSYSSSSGSSACTACAAGKITDSTVSTYSSCNIACTNSTGVASWKTPTWNSSNNTVTGLCEAASCSSGYTLIAGRCSNEANPRYWNYTISSGTIVYKNSPPSGAVTSVSGLGTKAAMIMSYTNGMAACAYANGRLFCLKHGFYSSSDTDDTVKTRLTNEMSSALGKKVTSCSKSSSDNGIYCYTADVYCNANPDGNVYCNDRNGHYCGVTNSGNYSYCY